MHIDNIIIKILSISPLLFFCIPYVFTVFLLDPTLLID